MSGFPSIKDDLRPRPKLKRHNDTPASDAEIEANSVAIGQKWGAATSLPTAEAPGNSPVEVVSASHEAPKEQAETLHPDANHQPPAETAPEAARVTSIRGYIPHYLDDELALSAVQRRVTKTFLIMEALAKAGYRVDEIDLVQDRRKKPRPQN